MQALFFSNLHPEITESITRNIIDDTDRDVFIEKFEEIYTYLVTKQDKYMIKQDFSKILVKNIPAYNTITDEQIEEINSKHDIPIKLTLQTVNDVKNKIDSRIPIVLEVKNASELSVKDLKELFKSGLNIQYVRFNDPSQTLSIEQEEPYEVATYIECRKEIDKLLSGIDFGKLAKNTNRDKIIFGKVITRLAKNITYDMSVLDVNMYYREITSRNLEGGLLYGESVCDGYAEIVRNVFACCGIEAICVSGNYIYASKSNGHTWNQIKLDGVWYNLDLTWARDGLVEGEPTKWLLKSDVDFNTEKHPFYSKHVIKHTCPISMKMEELQKYLNGENISKDPTEFIDNIIEDVTISDMQKSKKILKYNEKVKDEDSRQNEM